MTHEAGIWIFGIITLVCLSVWLLCRRSKAVEDAVESVPFHYEPNERVIGVGAQTWSYAMPIVPAEKPKLLQKGWRGWEGGECPVPWYTEVVVMRRGGMIDKPFKAGYLGGWDHYERSNDIVAWRVA